MLIKYGYIDGLMQERRNSSANALLTLQLCDTIRGTMLFMVNVSQCVIPMSSLSNITWYHVQPSPFTRGSLNLRGLFY